MIASAPTPHTWIVETVDCEPLGINESKNLIKYYKQEIANVRTSTLVEAICAICSTCAFSYNNDCEDLPTWSSNWKNEPKSWVHFGDNNFYTCNADALYRLLKPEIK